VPAVVRDVWTTLQLIVFMTIELRHRLNSDPSPIEWGDNVRHTLSTWVLTIILPSYRKYSSQLPVRIWRNAIRFFRSGSDSDRQHGWLFLQALLHTVLSIQVSKDFQQTSVHVSACTQHGRWVNDHRNADAVLSGNYVNVSCQSGFMFDLQPI